MAKLPQKAYVGGNLVLASGTLCVPFGQIAEVVPLPQGLAPLRFQFRFEETEGGRPQVGTDVTGAPLVVVRLINMNAALGQSTTSPLRVGSIGNRSMELSVSVHGIGLPPTRMHVLAYTFTLTGGADA